MSANTNVTFHSSQHSYCGGQTIAIKLGKDDLQTICSIVVAQSSVAWVCVNLCGSSAFSANQKLRYSGCQPLSTRTTSSTLSLKHLRKLATCSWFYYSGQYGYTKKPSDKPLQSSCLRLWNFPICPDFSAGHLLPQGSAGCQTAGRLWVD